MAAIALILRDINSQEIERLGEIDIKVSFKLLGRDVYWTYMYRSDDRVSPYIKGCTNFFNEKIDANHIVHDCGNDFELFFWGVQNPLKFYNWQYQERGYNDPKTRKKSLQNDEFKKEIDELNKKERERRELADEAFAESAKFHEEQIAKFREKIKQMESLSDEERHALLVKFRESVNKNKDIIKL